METYIFEKNKKDQELVRLRMIEAAKDTSSINLLEDTGLQQGWTCLEIGPGAGSMLRWIGEKVGTSGKVVGVEKNPIYLGGLDSPPYEITEGDFGEVAIEGSFDLVYGRYTLIHNRNFKEIIRKIHGLVKPGGFAVLEEPDFTSATLLKDGSDTSHHRVNSAICKMFVDYGLDPACGLRLPQNLRKEGFHIAETRSTMHLCPGKSPIANLMAESALVLSKEYQKTGEATSEDLHQYVTNAQNPEFWSVYYSTISVIAQR